jgi:uncharacterized protein YndB with AHSA1/START domain
MAGMFHQVQVDADAKAAFDAITTHEGITGWWTSQAEVPPAEIGAVVRPRFPDLPMRHELRIAQLDEPTTLVWRCTGGPPGWVGTQIAWNVQAAGTGAVIRLDHTGWAEVDDMFRIVTVGWAQMLLSLKAYLDSGQHGPFFDF